MKGTIAWKDFVADVTEAGGFFKPARYEEFQDVVDEVNGWISSEGVDVINIETVVLPNLHATYEEGSTDVELLQTSTGATKWNQFLRVWYRSPQGATS